MNGAHLHDFDLNLLRVLDALLTERSATRAATKLQVSQSAVSHALGRLRHQLGDPLMVRAGSSFVPTPRAEALREPLRRALDALGTALAPSNFDPATARSSFVVGAPDYGVVLVLPELLRDLEATAPGVEVVVVPPLEDPIAALTDGSVDVVIGTPGLEGDGLYTQRLFEDDFRCVLRRGHPALSGPWTAEVFASLRHALIAPRGRPGGAVDAALDARSLSRRVVVRVPHFLAVPHLVATTDLVVTMPSRLAARVTPGLDVVVVEPPLPLPGFTIVQLWHERRHADPAHRWLRRRIAAAAETAH